MRSFPVFLAFLFSVVPARAQTGGMRTVDFATEVHPVLETRCKSCHAGDHAQAGFRVSSREDLMRGGASGPAIVPGKGADSLLIQKITGRRGTRMPPSGSPLNDDAITAIRAGLQGSNGEGMPQRVERRSGEPGSARQTEFLNNSVECALCVLDKQWSPPQRDE